MNEPYYADESVTLWHGDCREITDWLAADVLVTDPPYGIAWDRPEAGIKNSWHNPGIANDGDTSARDQALELWGAERPAIAFGSLKNPIPNPRMVLVFAKPSATASGLFGAFLPWRKDWEPVYVLGRQWPKQPSVRSSVIATGALSAGGYRGYATQTEHPHTKPMDVMEQLISACPAGIIADPFAGSGSTLIAARNLGRRAIGVEIEERYVEIAVKRLQQGVLPLDVVDPGENLSGEHHALF